MALQTVCRYERGLTVTIEGGANLSESIDMAEMLSLAVHLPSDWTAASIGFKAAPTPDGAYQPVYNNTGLLQISSPAASKTYIAPGDIAGCRYVKLWSQDGSGVNVNQAADRAIFVCLKA